MLAILNGSKRLSKGISIVEILIVVAIIGLVFINIFTVNVLALKFSALTKQTTQANSLAQETIEAVRNFRDGTDWDGGGLGTLTTGTNYYPQKFGSPQEWQIISGIETINGFSRKFVLESVSRDPATNEIEAVYDPGHNDPNTRKITISVSWRDREVKIISYLTNWQ